MLKKFAAIQRENLSWLALALLLFISGFVLALAALRQDPTLVTMLEEAALATLQELSEEIFKGSPLQGVIILFMHNLMSTLYIMFLGIILGVPSLMSAVANGSLLGLVTFQLTQKGIAPLPFLLAGILPHGIFELPAFFISVALGLKLGYHVVFPLPGISRMNSLRTVFREIGTSLPFIIGLLAIAALVEVLITPRILAPFL